MIVKHYRHGLVDPIIAQWRGISYEGCASGPMAGSLRIYPDKLKITALAVDECAIVWSACPEFRRGMSPHMGVF